MQKQNMFLVFSVDNTKFALPYNIIEFVTRAVKITRLPDSPENISGIINIHGSVVPVVNLRKLLNYPLKDVLVEDRLIVIKHEKDRFTFVVDAISGLERFTEKDIVDLKSIADGLDMFSYTLKAESGLVLVFDAEKLVSAAEINRMYPIMAGSAGISS